MALKRLLFVACVGTLLWSSWGQNVEPELVLITSSPFSMVIQPTSIELDHPSLRALEEAASSVILLQQRREAKLMFADAEVVVQQVEYGPPDPSSDQPDEETFSTLIRFFVLGSTFVNTTTDNASRQVYLDSLVLRTFASTQGKAQLLELVQSDPILGQATSVVVTEIVPPTNDVSHSNDSRKLSTLDIFLIIISGLIFLGILYMVVEHIKDRGYIEHQRLQAFNERPVVYYDPNEDVPVTTVHSSPHQTLKVERIVVDPDSDNIGSMNHHYTNGHALTNGQASVYTKNDDDDDDTAMDTPGTPSTTNSVVDFNSDPVTPERVVRITTTTINAADPDVLVSEHPSPLPLQEEPKELLEEPPKTSPLSENYFESKWFQPAHSKPNLQRPRTVDVLPDAEHHSEDEEEDVDSDDDDSDDDMNDDESSAAGIFEDASSSSSDNGGTKKRNNKRNRMNYEEMDDDDQSIDVFEVDVASCAKSTDDTNKSIASAASAVTEWMKSIRVVSTTVDQKMSEMTPSSSADEEKHLEDSSGTTSSSIGDDNNSASLGETSLEHRSLEKSMASSHPQQRPIKKMEV